MTDLVFIGDTHLRDAVWANKPLGGDSYDSWEQIISYVTGGKDCGVVLLGDILDRRSPASKPVMVMKEGLEKLVDHCGQVVAIQGQHDRATPPWFRIVDSVGDKIIHLNPETITGYKGYKMAGCDNMSRPQLLETLQFVPKDVKLLALHNLLTDAISRDFGDVSLAELPDIPIIAMGDLHNIATFEDQPGEFKRIVFHGGSTCMQKINEVPTKIFHHLKNGRLTQVPLKTRRIVKRRITKEAELEKLIAEIPADGKSTIDHATLPTLVYVSYPSKLTSAYSKLMEVCKKEGYFFWASPYYVEEMMVNDQTASDSLDSTDECLKAVVKEGTPEFNYISKLLTSREARQTIEEERPDSASNFIEGNASR